MCMGSWREIYSIYVCFIGRIELLIVSEWHIKTENVLIGFYLLPLISKKQQESLLEFTPLTGKSWNGELYLQRAASRLGMWGEMMGFEATRANYRARVFTWVDAVREDAKNVESISMVSGISFGGWVRRSRHGKIGNRLYFIWLSHRRGSMGGRRYGWRGWKVVRLNTNDKLSAWRLELITWYDTDHEVTFGQNSGWNVRVPKLEDGSCHAPRQTSSAWHWGFSILK